MERLEKLIKKCAQIIEAYEQKINNEAGRFNIFNILNVESKEVRLHSRFIAELLDVKGAHKMGGFFLGVFLEKLRAEHYDVSFSDIKYSVAVEKQIGTINNDYTKGGRIDILLIDRDDNCIVIENKIYAGDQENQLMRYENYIKSNHQNGYIIYLTLDGKRAHENVEHISISYNDFIVDWLKKCMERIENDQVISHIKSSKIKVTINQYIEIITNYLIPSNENEMTEQIINLLKDSENLKTIHQISKIYKQHLDNTIYNKFWEELHKEIQENDLEKFFINELNLELEVNEAYRNFWFGYQISNYTKYKHIKDWNRLVEKISIYNSNIETNNNHQIYSYGSGAIAYNKSFSELLNKEENIDMVLNLMDDNGRKIHIGKIIKEITELRNNIKSILENTN